MIRRLLRGWIAGLSILPIRPGYCSDPPPLTLIQDEAEVLENSIADVYARSTPSGLVYTGKTIGTEERFHWEGKVVRPPGNWENLCLNRTKAEAFLRSFIEARTR